MRNPVACVSCRTARQRCIHDNGKSPCERCRNTGRVDCRFPPPGTSAEHRVPKRLRHVDGADENDLEGARSHSRSNSKADLDGVDGRQEIARRDPEGRDLDEVDKWALITDEVKNSFLRCSYKWCFFHVPSLLVKIREKTVEEWVIWSILALSVRFSAKAPAGYTTSIEASNAFAAHARSILQPDLETPDISRIQCLLMLAGHSWGRGEGRRAWVYLGMAIRHAQILDLFEEPEPPKTREEFIMDEEKRRTAWTCFLMDSLLSGGKGRKRTLIASDMNIALPCETDRYVFGEPVRCERLNGSMGRHQDGNIPLGKLGVIGHCMRIADVWGTVAKWACSHTDELPWTESSQFTQISRQLKSWEDALPTRLKYSLDSLHAHNAIDQGQAFCYMHMIYFMSIMFMHRAYLPAVGTDRAKAGGEPPQWEDWRARSRVTLFRAATAVCEMMEEMKSFGLYFVRGLVPWCGFTIYTATGVLLYYHSFPLAGEDPSIAAKAWEEVVNGCLFLKDLNQQWPMANHWFETIKRMQAYYQNIKTGNNPISPDESRELQNAMVDYGALQPSPVHVRTPASEKTTVPSPATIQSPGPRNPSFTHPSSSNLLRSAPLPTPPFSAPMNVQNTPAIYDTNGFGINGFSDTNAFMDPQGLFGWDGNAGIDNAELEALFAQSTQDFWASFPGETGFY